MAFCTDSLGAVEDGNLVFFIVESDSQDLSNCAHVMLSSSDYQNIQDSIGNNPFSLSVSEAQQIGGSIFLLFAVAFCFRTLRVFLSDWSNQNE